MALAGIPRSLRRPHNASPHCTGSNAFLRSTKAASIPYQDSRRRSTRTRGAGIRSLIDLLNVNPHRCFRLQLVTATSHQQQVRKHENVTLPVQNIAVRPSLAVLKLRNPFFFFFSFLFTSGSQVLASCLNGGYYVPLLPPGLCFVLGNRYIRKTFLSIYNMFFLSYLYLACLPPFMTWHKPEICNS